jgi:hypothetical protein
MFRMKRVRLSEEAFYQLASHPYLTEDTIIGVVEDLPKKMRIYTDSTHFHITFHRKKNKKWVSVTIWVHEREYEDIVYGIHSTRP